KHRAHQVVDALPWLKQAFEWKIPEIMVPELRDLGLRDKGGGRTYLPIITNHQYLSPPKQRRQFGHIRLRCFVNDYQIENAQFSWQLFRNTPSGHDPARDRIITAGHCLAC